MNKTRKNKKQIGKYKRQNYKNQTDKISEKKQPYKIKKNRRSGKIKTTLDNNKDKKGEKLTDKTTELILSRK